MKKIIIQIICLFAIVAASCFLLFNDGNKQESIKENPTNEVIDEVDSTIDKDAELHKQIFADNTFNNPDYKGQIIFESGIINEPFVQANDNSFYLRRDYRTYKYDGLGTIFMDYECNLDSQNVILYGHYVYDIYDSGLDENGNKYDNSKLMFTPLRNFKDKEFYEANKYVDLVLQDSIKRYEVVTSFYCDVMIIDGVETLNPDLMYFIPEFDRDYFMSYKQKIKEVEFYDTGVSFTYDDSLLTLQTCVENHEELRQVVICKLIDTKYYQ